MGAATRRKWDKISGRYDLLTFADDRRFGPYKQRLFSKIRGVTLMVGVGTGSDIKFLPPNLHAMAIDISPEMLEHARGKAASYSGSIELREMDVCVLAFEGGTFDTVVTAFTFCSVPRPLVALCEIHRVLKTGGQLLMLEHVRSEIGPFRIMMDLISPLASRIGPALNRDTVVNVQNAGFLLRRVQNVYLDIVKMIEAVKTDGQPISAMPHAAAEQRPCALLRSSRAVAESLVCVCARCCAEAAIATRTSFGCTSKSMF